MVTLFRWLLRLTVGLIVLTLAAIALVWYFAFRSLPDYGAGWTVTGLDAPVEIVRTTDAVPHIFAASDRDAFLALGFAHAQDRLFQMVVLRRAAQGRLSEFYGERTFAADDLVRRLGLATHARASLGAQDAYARTALDAYAQGVNQWIEAVNRGALGRGAPEFFLYSDRIPYWQAEDSLAIMKLIAAGSTRAIEEEILRARLSLAAPGKGPDIIDRGDDPFLPDYAILFPNAGIAAPEPGDNAWSADDAALAGYVAPGEGIAGTGFAAAPGRTAAGASLLAGTMDLPLTVPSLFYLARLELDTGGVIGATIPGIPAVISGRNPTLAWNLAPAGIDDQDLMIEEVAPDDSARYRDIAGWSRFDTRREVIRIRGGEDRTITLRNTASGPVLPSAHMQIATILPPNHVAALSWTGLSDQDTTISALLKLMRADGRAAAAAAAAGIIAPAMDVTLTDRTGVTWLLAGARPARSGASETTGLMPAAGWVADNRWQGMLPVEANPLQDDPPGGSVATVSGTGSRDPGPRLARLAGLLDSRNIHSRDSFIAAQLDTVSPVARTLLPLVGANLWFTGEPARSGTAERQRQDALDLLAQWNGEMSDHLPEPAIYAVWMDELQIRLTRDEVGPVAGAIKTLQPQFIERVFRNSNNAGEWCDIAQSAAVETCALIARQALDGAIERLTERFGPDVTSWRWGNLHEARQRHPALGSAPLLGLIANLRQSVSGGDFTLSLAASRGHGLTRWATAQGAGFRVVHDLADPDNSVFVIATGQSGHPLSRHYDDLGELWQQGEYISMSLDPALARAGAEGITHLVPAATPG